MLVFSWIYDENLLFLYKLYFDTCRTVLKRQKELRQYAIGIKLHVYVAWKITLNNSWFLWFLDFLEILAFLIISITNIRLIKCVISHYFIDILASLSSWNWQVNKHVIRIMAISVHGTMIYIGFIILKFILTLLDYVWRRHEHFISADGAKKSCRSTCCFKNYCVVHALQKNLKLR